MIVLYILLGIFGLLLLQFFVKQGGDCFGLSFGNRVLVVPRAIEVRNENPKFWIGRSGFCEIWRTRRRFNMAVKVVDVLTNKGQLKMSFSLGHSSVLLFHGHERDRSI